MGVRVHYAPISILRRRFSPAELALFGPTLLRGAAAIATLARRIGADLIHTNMEVVLDGAIAARWLGLPARPALPRQQPRPSLVGSSIC